MSRLMPTSAEPRPFQDVDGLWCAVDEDGFAVVGERFNTEKEAIQWMEAAPDEDEKRPFAEAAS